jgi:chemotaxis protein methyltransferase CheR
VLGGLGDRDYLRICRLVRARSGIELGPAKRQLCQTRLLRRLRALGLASFAAYLALLDDDDSPEHGELINAITTNVTSFYREPHHFELLGTLLRAASQPRIRVWSAGCSTGEEPWSMAITVREVLGDCAGLDVKILATDIDTHVLERASAGVYTDEQLAPISRALRLKYFGRSGRASDELRALVTFKQLNLFEPWPMRGPFDVIACRNVIIYFDTDSKAKLVQRYHELLAPGGHLLLGHSESLAIGGSGFELVGRTAYRKARA